MRVWQISTFDHRGGAARAAYRQHQALRRFGVDCKMLVRFKTSEDPTVETFTPNGGRIGKITRAIRRAADRLERRNDHQWSTSKADLGYEVARYLNGKADIINLHQVDGFIDTQKFFAMLDQDIPIVVTMHDLAMVTGGCHYAGECRRFEQQCGQCPLREGQRDNDLSRRVWHRRQRAYGFRNTNNLSFVCDSRWLEGEVKSSSLAAGRSVSTIYYGIDTDVYHSNQREAARCALGLPHDKPVVMFAAANVGDARKGFGILKAAIESTSGLRDACLISAGHGNADLGTSVNRRHYGSVHDERLMSLLYRSCDVFVIPSVEEAFGQTALEAVACGTPAVGFDTGGIPEIIKDGVNGGLVPTCDAEQLRARIMEVLANRALADRWRSSCREFVERRFSYKINASRYAKLYESLMN